ncbi:MAG TPA: GAF domain-containing protein [Vicinamibacterales bacterium]|jgi:GAF domain-containing protein|nr:GAF domain-containing protein [Vicinamibacterales bacterium]
MHTFRSAAPLRTTPHSVAAFRLIDRGLRRALPGLGDFAFVHVRARNAIVGVAAAHHRGDQTRLVRSLMRAYRVAASDPVSAVAHVIRTGKPLMRSDIYPDASDQPPMRAHRVTELHRQLAPRSALVVPIVVRNSVLGALSLCYSDSRRRYSQASLPAARQLATQMGYVLMMAAEPQGFQLTTATRARPHSRDAARARPR